MLTGICCFNKSCSPYIEVIKIPIIKEYLDFAIDNEELYQLETTSKLSDSKKKVLIERAKILNGFNESFIAGHILFVSGDYDGALKSYQEYLYFHSNDRLVRLFIYQTLMILGDEKTAIYIIDSGEYQYDELVSFLRFKDFDISFQEAMPIIRKITKIDSANSETWKLWLETGLKFQYKNQYFEALQIFYEALDYQKNNNLDFYRSSFWLYIGRIYQSGLRLKNQEVLLDIYAMSKQSNDFLNTKDESYLHLYLGDIYKSYSDGDYYEDVLEEYQKALLMNPNDFSILLEIGYFNLNYVNNYYLAKYYLEKAITQNPNNPYGYYHLGDTYLNLGNRRLAIKNYQLALSKDNKFSLAIKKLENLQNID